MRWRRGGLVLVMCCVTSLVGAPAAAVAETAETKHWQATYRLVSNNWNRYSFANLEQLAREHRRSFERSPNGEITLSYFYRALDEKFRSTVTRDVTTNPASQRIRKWLQDYPSSVTAKIVSAMYFANLVEFWLHVTKQPGVNRKDNWRPVAAYLDQALALLDQAADRAPSHPHWYVVRLKIAALDSATPEQLIGHHARAMAAAPRYFPIHYAVIDSLMRSTHASKDQLPAAVLQLRNNTKAALRDEAYARLHVHIFREKLRFRTAAELKPSWELLKRGLARIAEDFPTHENQNLMAIFACMLGDRSTTRTQLRKIGGNAVRQVWHLPSILDHCRNWSAASSWMNMRG